MTEADVFAFLVANLRLESETRSEYCGGDDSGRMYRDKTTVRLMLGDKCLGEVDA